MSDSVAALLTVLLGLGWASGIAEESQDRSAILAAARELMESTRFCALITRGEDGHPQARAMDPFHPTEDFHVWMGTRAGTRKLQQIEAESRVTLYYFSSDPPGYVTLLGTARIIRDPEAKRRFWKPEWAEFYDDSNLGSDYLLIDVAPQSIEVVSYRHNIASDPKSWKPAIVTFPGTER